MASCALFSLARLGFKPMTINKTTLDSAGTADVTLAACRVALAALVIELFLDLGVILKGQARTLLKEALVAAEVLVQTGCVHGGDVTVTLTARALIIFRWFGNHTFVRFCLREFAFNTIMAGDTGQCTVGISEERFAT